MIRLLWWLVTILALSTGRRSFPFPQPAVEPPVTDTNHDTEPDHDDTPEIGDLVQSDENPVLHAQTEADTVDVWVNVGLAESPNGQHAIRLRIPPNGVLTAAEADRLQRRLARASQFVADIRRDAGYTS